MGQSVFLHYVAEVNRFKDEGLILACSFRGFNPWSAVVIPVELECGQA